MSTSEQTVILVGQRETLAALVERLETVSGSDDLIIVFPRLWKQGNIRSRQEFFEHLRSRAGSVVIASANHLLTSQAAEKGFDTLEDAETLTALLDDHPDNKDALRQFSGLPLYEWIARLKESLKRFSVSRVRIWILLIGSIVLFGAVVGIALPSASIHVWPRIELVNHTANVLLVSSGSSVVIHQGQNTLPLVPIRVYVERALTFDDVSKNFTGENAEVLMAVINEGKEPYSLRQGTRLVNQAGMIFKLLSSVTVPAAVGIDPGITEVYARADPEDIYGEIVGERGNVPTGIRWDFPGLTQSERALIYARNTEDAKGGITKYGNLVQHRDVELAKTQIEQELLRAARVRVQEEVESMSVQEGRTYTVFTGAQYDVLTQKTYSGITIPTQLVGESVASIPVEGALTYMQLAYDKDGLLNILMDGLKEHVEKGYEFVEESVTLDHIAVYVIEYDDALSWVKITADLTGKQRAILSPLTAEGRFFQDRLRDRVTGMSLEEAKRVIQNFPEVEKVTVSVWPPWHMKLPSIPNHIVIDQEES